VLNPRQRLWSAALLIGLAVHALVMARHGWGELAHLLWSCHVATAALALGLLGGWSSLAWAGFLFHLAIGFPAWLIEVIVTRGTFGAAQFDGPLLATSIVVHGLPLAAGFAVLGAARPPRAAIAIAWALQVALVPVSRALTPPVLNVNLAWAVWPPLTGAFPRLWMFQAALSAASLLLLLAAALAWPRVAALTRARTDVPAKGSAV